MKRIINGKLYNTETAKYIGNDTNNAGSHEFHYFNEDLYKKKTGEFFLSGEGNGHSRYAPDFLNGYWNGCYKKIIPLSIEEAKEWCERRLGVDDYVELFGPVEE